MKLETGDLKLIWLERVQVYSFEFLFSKADPPLKQRMAYTLHRVA